MYFVTIKNLNFKPEYQIWQNVTRQFELVDYPYGYLDRNLAEKVYNELKYKLSFQDLEIDKDYLLVIDEM